MLINYAGDWGGGKNAAVCFNLTIVSKDKKRFRNALISDTAVDLVLL